MSKPFVSIIIPVRNAARTIETTFQYIMNIDYPHSQMELIFADGDSTDDTVKIIQEYQSKHSFIKLVQVPKCPSPGYARTQALKVAKGEYIFFTDGDCAPCKDWIDQMLSIFDKDEKIGAVGGEIYTLRVEPNNLVEIYCEAFGFNRVSWRYGNLQEGYYPEQGYLPTQICGHRSYFFVTANVAYRKQAVEDAQRKFWEFPTGEDIDFGIRVRKKGWKFYFLPSASVQHMHRATLPALRRVWNSYGQAHGLLIKHHASSHLEIVFQFIGLWPNHPVLTIPFPIKGYVYIGNFYLVHIYGIIFLLTFIFQWVWPTSLILRILAWLSCFFAAFHAFHFFRPAFNIEPYWEWKQFAKMKYITNWDFFWGGLKHSIKNKAFCIEPSF